MEATTGQLSKEEHDKIFLKIERGALRDITPIKEGEQLTAVFLAGQPGSGKSGLKHETRKELSLDRTITIDVDDLRERHPKYSEWRSNPETEKIASTLSHGDASAWGQQLVRTAINNKCNIIVDGTLGHPESTQKQFDVLKEAGYKIVVKGLAVQQEVSELGVYKRFEDGKAKNEPRWVPPEVQDKVYHGLPQTLDVIEQNRTRYDAHVQVYNRKGDKLDDNREVAPDGPKSAREALDAERNRPLSREEKKTYSDQWSAVIESMAKRNAPPEEIQVAAKKSPSFTESGRTGQAARAGQVTRNGLCGSKNYWGTTAAA